MVDVTKIDAFVQSSPHPAWLATSRGECLYVNPALERLIGFGLKSDQINQVDWRSFVLEEDRAAASASWQKSFASGTPYRTRLRLRGSDGVPVTVELIAFGPTPNDGTELWLFTSLYLHSDTQLYPRLEAQLQATLNVIPAHTWYALPSGGLTFVNERTADYLGLPKDHPLRFGIDTGGEWDSHIPLLHPDDREESRRVWSICIRTGSVMENSFRVRNAEGGYRWFLSRVEPLRASDGILLYWIGVNLDIDERKRAEEKIRGLEMEARQILDLTPQHVAVVEHGKERIFANRALLNYFGLRLEEWQSRGTQTRVHPDDWERLMLGQVSPPDQYEARLRRYDGEYRGFWSVTIRCTTNGDRLRVGLLQGPTSKTASKRREAAAGKRRPSRGNRQGFDVRGNCRHLEASKGRSLPIARVAPTDSTVLIRGRPALAKNSSPMPFTNDPKIWLSLR